ncbi:unnamed protein product [Vitrella brassicaformis CCMP3155]|uniref:Uncharacterized protein n=2 Tax=Vitrella brassicaformis TaxID=1169539 RepID=A0A0G4FSH1_VITBC|nr:unnamed protein product [Vitrella brassicaformis CCMP3155]|eukprot:CEM17372.1 unnamed protein product [Vitrella brassicaformis CCMP3155]
MASSTRGMHGLTRLPAELWTLNLSGTLTDKEIMRLSVLDESCFEAVCSSTLVIGPAVPRDRRVLLCSQGPQKIILVAAEGETSFDDDVLRFFVTTMQQHGDKIRAIKSDVPSPGWDYGGVEEASLVGAARTFPALTDIDVDLVRALKVFRSLQWKTPNLRTLRAKFCSERSQVLDLTTSTEENYWYHDVLRHLLAHSPHIRRFEVFPLPTHICGTALEMRGGSLESMGDMVSVPHDKEIDRLLAGLPCIRIRPPALQKCIGVFYRNLTFRSTLPASFNPTRHRSSSGELYGPAGMQLLVELESRGYCVLPKGSFVELRGSSLKRWRPADTCPPEMRGSIRDIVKRALQQAITVEMTYHEFSQPWDDCWDLTDSSGRPVVFDKTKYLIIRCGDSTRGYVGHDAIAGWTVGGWKSVEVLTLEQVEYQSVKDHITYHKHRFTEDGVYEKGRPSHLSSL